MLTLTSISFVRRTNRHIPLPQLMAPCCAPVRKKPIPSGLGPHTLRGTWARCGQSLRPPAGDRFVFPSLRRFWSPAPVPVDFSAYILDLETTDRINAIGERFHDRETRDGDDDPTGISYVWMAVTSERWVSPHQGQSLVATCPRWCKALPDSRIESDGGWHRVGPARSRRKTHDPADCRCQVHRYLSSSKLLRLPQRQQVPLVDPSWRLLPNVFFLSQKGPFLCSVAFCRAGHQ